MTQETGVAASLGAGSYDYDKIYGSDAEKALELEPAQRQAAIDDLVAKADTTKTANIDPRDTPGYKWKTVTNNGFKERIQVPDEAFIENADAEQEPATPAPTTNTSAASTGKNGSTK